jgi:hypothetical protein
MHKGQTYKNGEYGLHELDKMAYFLVTESEVPSVRDFVQGFSGDPFIEKVAKKIPMAKDIKKLYGQYDKATRPTSNFITQNPGAAGALVGAGLGAVTSKDDRLGGAVMGAGIGGLGGHFGGKSLFQQNKNVMSKKKFNKRLEGIIEKRQQQPLQQQQQPLQQQQQQQQQQGLNKKQKKQQKKQQQQQPLQQQQQPLQQQQQQQQQQNTNSGYSQNTNPGSGQNTNPGSGQNTNPGSGQNTNPGSILP